MDGNSGAGARPKPRPLGVIAAQASLWRLAPALLILVFGAYLSGSILDLSWLRLSSITIVLAAAIAGILLSATALVAPGGVNRQAILWLVVCGVVGNSLCIVDIGAWAVAERGRTRQIARTRAERGLGRQVPRAYADLPVQTALSAAETRYTNAQKQLKRFAATGDGESAGFAEACSHMLEKEHKLMEA